MSRGKKEIKPYWRPNFVNQSELPDIKVIRTDFIINLIAVSVALGLVFFLGQREYRIYTLGDTVSELEEQIRIADPDDAKFLKLSGEFKKSAKYIEELEKFFDAPFLHHEFLHAISGLKPKDLVFNSFSLSESVKKVSGKDVLAYQANIVGDAKNLSVLDEFKELLEQAEFLEIDGFVNNINEKVDGRDEKTGVFPYRLSISFTPSAGKPVAKKGEAK